MEVTQVALVAHQAGILIGGSLVEIELLQREELLAYLFAHRIPVSCRFHRAVNMGLPVDGGQVYGGQHVHQLPRHPPPFVT